jgi:hypothetical protein
MRKRPLESREKTRSPSDLSREVVEEDSQELDLEGYPCNL